MDITIDNIKTKEYPSNNEYLVSNNGDVYSLKNKMWIKSCERGNGYLKVSLKINGVTKTISLHRVVAETYILNPENKKCVNHKDCNKKNNNATNLEWCTHSENAIHAKNAGLLDESFIAVSESNKRRWADGRNEYLREVNRNRAKERWADGTLRAAISSFNKKVIDVSTNIIYSNITEAAISNNINKSTLRVKLTGHRNNNTNLRYL